MSSKKDKCLFNESCLTDKRFSPWLKRSTKQRPYFRFCSKDFDISNMGCSDLTSHASGKRHSKILGLKSLNVGSTFFESLGRSETSVKPTTSLETVESMVVSVSTLQVEVIWVLKVVKNHFSLRSCLGLNDLFKKMFPDSEIVKPFKLSKTGYLISYADA